MAFRTKVSTNIKKKKISFFRQVQQELKKVTWTTKTELILYAKVVVAGVFFLGLGIYLADFVIKLALDSLNALVRVIGG